MNYNLIVLNARHQLPKVFRNHIVYNKNVNFYNHYETPYTIKYVANGEKFYHIGQKIHHLVANNILTINHEQELVCLPGKVGRTISVFLESATVSDVWSTNNYSESYGLDNPMLTNRNDIHCMEQIQDSRENALGVYLQKLLKIIELNSNIHRISEDLFFEIAELMICSQMKIRQQLARLNVAKPSTRFEIIQRLEKGKSFLLDYWKQEISLEEVAKTAHLSPYHFHRRFREAYGETPKQFIERIRIQHARQLLQSKSLSVTEVAFSCGFSDLAAFSNIFKKREGVSPTLWRNQFN